MMRQIHMVLIFGSGLQPLPPAQSTHLSPFVSFASITSFVRNDISGSENIFLPLFYHQAHTHTRTHIRNRRIFKEYFCTWSRLRRFNCEHLTPDSVHHRRWRLMSFAFDISPGFFSLLFLFPLCAPCRSVHRYRPFPVQVLSRTLVLSVSFMFSFPTFKL